MLDEMQRLEAHKHFQRGLILEQAGRYDEAVEEYRQAIAYNPHLREAHDALAAYYHRHGLLAKAADELRIVAALEEDPIAYFNLGSTLADLGRYDVAREALERCLALDPKDHAAGLELAYVDYASGRYEEAVARLTQLLPVYKDDWEAHNLIGLCLLRLGRYQDARLAFSHSLLLAGDQDSRDEVLRHITAVDRYSEFRKIRSLKDRLYAEEGVICLGSAQDDGLNIPEYEQYHFTEQDIATTLSRFVSLVRALHLPLTAVAAIDRSSLPLARVLSSLLELAVREPVQLSADDYVLLVGGVVREAEFLDVAAEQLSCDILWFCLAITWQNHPTVAPPDVLGVIARNASLPWSEDIGLLLRQGAPRATVEHLIADVAARLSKAFAELPEEPLRQRQVRYYTQRHRNIAIL